MGSRLLLALALWGCGAKSGLRFAAEPVDEPDAEVPGDAGADAGRDAGSDAGEDAGVDASIPPNCGDGVVQADEECDDANRDDTDDCLSICRVASCGDGFVHAGIEECDDANRNDTDACVSTCRLAFCGDGLVRAGIEQCDDANRVDTDACLTGCLLARCGDGFVRAGVEQCDDANRDDTDACVSTCLLAVCGDGFVRAGVEQCDEGADNADIPAWAVRQGAVEILPQPVGSTSSAVTFYDYRSASAHTGFEAPERAAMFAYQETDDGDRSLFIVFSQDDGGFDGTAEIVITGLGGGDPVLLSDDPQRGAGELDSAGGGTVHGHFEWFSNSDGGVVELECPLVVTFEIVESTFIDEWVYVEADGTLDTLDLDDGAEIECNTVAARCRTSCRFPACGDGFLDPGEECDDGNVAGGDRCPSDCDL